MLVKSRVFLHKSTGCVAVTCCLFLWLLWLSYVWIIYIPRARPESSEYESRVWIWWWDPMYVGMESPDRRRWAADCFSWECWDNFMNAQCIVLIRCIHMIEGRYTAYRGCVVAFWVQFINLLGTSIITWQSKLQSASQVNNGIRTRLTSLDLSISEIVRYYTKYMVSQASAYAMIELILIQTLPIPRAIKLVYAARLPYGLCRTGIRTIRWEGQTGNPYNQRQWVIC